MRRRPFLTLLGVSVGTGGCVGSPRGTVRTEAAADASPGSARPPPSAGVVVEMSGSTRSNYGGSYWFDPVGLAVPPGTTVTWRSGQGAPHTATAYPNRIPPGAEAFSSPRLAHGLTFEHAFEVPGVYDYYCVPHRARGMVGRVVCGKPDVEPGQPPDGTVPTVARMLEEGRVAASQL